jgi:hypothetical protein
MRRRRENISPITLFYLSLLFWDVVQGMAWTISIQWIQTGRIVIGQSCVAQGMSSVPFSTSSTKIPSLIFLLFIAILKQFDAIGTSLSIVAMSWCIFHDYVIESNDILTSRVGYIGIGLILTAQAMIIMLPNIILGGAYNYYGISE